MIEVTASRDGEIREIAIRVGDVVLKNQELMLIGSPELSTLILAVANGTIENIVVKVGDKVKSGQVLVRIDDQP
ncbi:MAG: Biotin-requiring enzyme [Firmicutes bacterium]|nr:Biotin-requiring enzyme [Bacillota bacterium]